jgi:hypothetical protein
MPASRRAGKEIMGEQARQIGGEFGGDGSIFTCRRFVNSENLFPLPACGLGGIEAVDRDPKTAPIRRESIERSK